MIPALDSFRNLDSPSHMAHCLYDLGPLDKATTLMAGIDAALAELPAA
jgi:hypothetical protein